MRNWKLSLICDSSVQFWGDWGLSLQSCAYQTRTLSLSYILSPVQWVLDSNTIQRQVKSSMLQEKKQWTGMSPENTVTLSEVPRIWEAQALLGGCYMSGHGAMAWVPSPFPLAQILIYYFLSLIINFLVSLFCVFFFLWGVLGSSFANSRSITLKDLVTFLFSYVFITTFSAFL